MADHDKPGISDTYVNVLADLDARMEDQAKGFDPATTTPTNLKTGSVRWSSASKKWQLWSGSAWNDLAAEYAINVSGAAAKLKTARNFSLTGGATAAAVGFDGTGNVALNVTALDGTKVSAATTSAKGAVTLADSTAIISGTPGRIVDAAQLKVVKDSIVSYDPTPSVTGTASFTRSSNTIAITGIQAALSSDKYGALAVGDVIIVDGTSSNDGLYTVESVSTNSIVVNDAHKAGAGPLSLTDETASCDVRLLAKWYMAPPALGRAWVQIPGMQRNMTRTNSTGREIEVQVYIRGTATGDPWIEAAMSNDGSGYFAAFAEGTGLETKVLDGKSYMLEIYQWLDLSPGINSAVQEWWELR